MKFVLLVFFVFLLNNYASAAIEVCDSFSFKWCNHHAGMFTVGILKSDYTINNSFQLQIENHDKTLLKSSLSNVVEKHNGRFDISLNANGTELLNQKHKLPTCKHVYVKMKIFNTKMHCGGVPPSITMLTIGSRTCKVRTQPSQSMEGLEYLKSCKQICSVCPRADVVDEIGFKVNLDVTVLWASDLMIAFKEDVENLNIVHETEQFKFAKWVKHETGCKKLHHFSLKFAKLLNRYAVIEIFFKRTNGMINTPPTITYIYYGNKKCSTYCGSNPCPGPSSAITTTTTTQPEIVTTTETLIASDVDMFNKIDDLDLDFGDVLSDDDF